jgi:hypothetical protein
MNTMTVLDRKLALIFDLNRNIFVSIAEPDDVTALRSRPYAFLRLRRVARSRAWSLGVT